MKYKIGIFGSSGDGMSSLDANIPRLATRLGELLGRRKDEVIIITGGCSGLPYMVAKTAAAVGAEVWGYSPATDLESHRLIYPGDDYTIYTKLVYIPVSYEFNDNKRTSLKYRNVTSTANCDAGIIISGRWGSLNELTNLVDQQKLVGVLTGTGGIADEMQALSHKISKEGQGKIVFNDDPELLVEALLEELKAKDSL